MELGLFRKYTCHCRKPRIGRTIRRIQSDEVTEILKKKKKMRKQKGIGLGSKRNSY